MSIIFNTLTGLAIIIGGAVLAIAVIIGALWMYGALGPKLSWAVYMGVVLLAVAYLIGYTIRNK